MAQTHFYHPGVVLRDLYLEECGLTQAELARGLGVAQARISELCNGKRDIDADISLRLSKFFGVDERLFINLQVRYDLELARARQRKMGLRVRPWRGKRAALAELV